MLTHAYLSSFCSITCILLCNLLRPTFLSEWIRGDLYTAERPERVNFLLSARSEIFVSGIQLDNKLKRIF